METDLLDTGYVLILQQAGEGCDYSIDCGTKVAKLRATSLDEAVKEAYINHNVDDYLTDSEYRCDVALIVHIDAHVDLIERGKKRRARAKKEKQLDSVMVDINKKKAELAALELMQEKLEDEVGTAVRGG